MKINKAQFNRAVKEGHYESTVMNPAIRFSEKRGFYVESSHHPRDEDVLWHHDCGRNANTGKPLCLPSIEEITEQILENQEGETA